MITIALERFYRFGCHDDNKPRLLSFCKCA